MTEQHGKAILRAIRVSDLTLILPNASDGDPLCVICSRLVSEEEVGGFVKTRDGPIIFCYRPECLEAVMSGRRQ